MDSSAVALKFITLFVLSASSLFGALIPGESTSSMKTYQEGTGKLTVYTDVPGHDLPITVGDGTTRNPRAKSPVYEIRVRSAATGNQWVRCFANHTYNRAAELPDIDDDEGKNSLTITQAYQDHTAGWSHTYANIEMSPNTTVEVEISKIGTNLLDGLSTIVKSAVHPAHKVFDQKTENGKVYFKLNNPCQVVIDINGQMDDHNAAFSALQQIGPVHAVSLFANPIMTKPPANDPDIRYVTAGTLPDQSDTNYTTMVFGPGVHLIGQGFDLHSKKNYYIPGDAILYGSLSNADTPVNGLSNGDSITVYGYGTVNGFFIPHHSYPDISLDNPEYSNPEYPDIAVTNPHGIWISDFANVTINGITIVDTANFATRLLPKLGVSNDQSKVIWTKLITWRANGDGIAAPLLVEDCFLRTADDLTTVAGDRRRCTLWKDSNANMVRLRNTYSSEIYVMEDCDLLYSRLRSSDGFNGSVFVVVETDPVAEVKPVNVTIRNIRFHDRNPNMRVFNLDSTAGSYKSYSGLKFENISCYVRANTTVLSNAISGTAAAPWYASPIFQNVTFRTSTQSPYDAGTLLTAANFGTYFETNSHVAPAFVPVATSALATSATNGWITLNPPPIGGVCPTGTVVTVTANPASGYTFGGWSGNLTGSTNPATITMDGNQSVTANFAGGNTYTLTETSSNGSVTFDPPGGTYTNGQVVTLTAVADSGYTFGSWSGNLTGTTNPATITMNGNRSVTANFISAAEAVPWVENFQSQDAGATSDGSPTSWTATPAIGNFRVLDGEMVYNNVGAGVFTTGAINISSGPVTVRLQVRSSSNLNVGQDYLRLYTKVDGGAEVRMAAADGPQAATIWTVSIPTGSKLVLVIRARVTATNEYYYFDNLQVVNANAAADPFIAWAGAGVNFADDANNDGVDDGMAWFLGTDQPSDPAVALLPKPAGNAGALVLEFDCLNATDRGTAHFELQYGSDLGQIDTWTGTAIPAAAGTFTDGVVDFVVTDSESAPGLLKVMATIPAGETAAGRMFARIKGIK